MGLSHDGVGRVSIDQIDVEEQLSPNVRGDFLNGRDIERSSKRVPGYTMNAIGGPRRLGYFSRGAYFLERSRGTAVSSDLGEVDFGDSLMQVSQQGLLIRRCSQNHLIPCSIVGVSCYSSGKQTGTFGAVVTAWKSLQPQSANTVYEHTSGSNEKKNGEFESH